MIPQAVMQYVIPLLPEVYLTLGAFFLLLFGVYRAPRVTPAQIALTVFFLAVTAYVVMLAPQGRIASPHNFFIATSLSNFAKLMILLSVGLVLMVSSEWLTDDNGKPFEILVLILMSTVGMMLMVQAADLVTIYLALELTSLPLYVLAASERDTVKSSEAGLKYFVLGALSSGMMLFGMSLVYGFGGTTQIPALTELPLSYGLMTGIVLIIVGFCFKISAVPFHMWTPDVYEGAPTPVTALFASAPKIAAITLFASTILTLIPEGSTTNPWQPVIILISVASMILGALAGLRQRNIKRLLAYSSIGHVGFMLMGLLVFNKVGLAAMLIYLALYIFMSVGAFACVLLMRKSGLYVEEIDDLAGVWDTRPWLVIAFSIFMFSMAGIPPLAGFFGKWYVVLAVVQQGFVGLAVIAVLSSVISCYYYIKIVKVMIFDEAKEPLDKVQTPAVRFALALCAAVTLCFFLAPSPLVATANQVAASFIENLHGTP